MTTSRTTSRVIIILLFLAGLFVLYTDGVTEAVNDSEEEFGEDRLIAALRQNANLSPGEILSATIDQIQRFSPHEQHDDMLR